MHPACCTQSPCRMMWFLLRVVVSGLQVYDSAYFGSGSACSVHKITGCPSVKCTEERHNRGLASSFYFHIPHTCLPMSTKLSTISPHCISPYLLSKVSTQSDCPRRREVVLSVGSLTKRLPSVSAFYCSPFAPLFKGFPSEAPLVMSALSFCAISMFLHLHCAGEICSVLFIFSEVKPVPPCHRWISAPS